MKWAPVLLLLFSVILAGCAASPPQGSGRLDTLDLQGKPAPDFTLVDQDGKIASLSRYRGKVVALTFLYTSCPDVCPIIANTFRQTYDKLGDARQKLEFVAVTVDPRRDTVQRIDEYLNTQGLRGKLNYLTGSHDSLEKVWSAYAIGVSRATPILGRNGISATYEVSHTVAVYLIDAQGRERTLIPSYKFNADQLINEMRPLISEAN